MFRRSPPSRRHRGRSLPARWVASPDRRAAVAAIVGTLVLVGVIVVAGLVGGTGADRVTPRAVPGAGETTVGTGTSTGGSPPAQTASTAPTGGGSPSASRPTSVQHAHTRPAPRRTPTPSVSPSTLDASVKHKPHHGKPGWARGGKTPGPDEQTPDLP